MKICTKCKKDKELKEFHEGHSGPGTYYSWCKECKNGNSRKNNPKYKETKDKWNKEQRPAYLEKTKEHIKEYSKNYRNSDKGKEIIKKLKQKEYKEKYGKDVLFTLNITLRNRVKNALKNNFKSGKTLELLDCTIKELKLWLENQFLPGMDWGNYGKVWEIDYIKACANFDLTKLEEQLKCFNYKNLMPRFITTDIARQFGSDQIGNRNKNKY